MQVEKMHDEGVQLKVLQTALTLMQSTTLAQNEASNLKCACMLQNVPTLVTPLRLCPTTGGHCNGPWHLLPPAG